MSGYPSFLAGNVRLQRSYLQELRRLRLRQGCSRDCGKAELDRKYARMVSPKPTLDKRRRKG